MTELTNLEDLAASYSGHRILFYDGSCPLCSKEIGALKRAETSLQFVDIVEIDQISTELRAQLLKRLHLRTTDDRWLVGLDANTAAWSGTFLGSLLKVTRWPIVRIFADWIYEIWADSRFSKRYCQADDPSGCV